MKLTQLMAALAALLCTAATAGGPTWNPIPVAPATNNYNQQQPDYAASVGNGFSKMAEALQQYEATRPTPKPSSSTAATRVGDRVTWPDGSYGVIVDDQIFITRFTGQKGVCTLAGSQIVDCKTR